MRARSINIEVSLLRGVMGSLWARLKEDDDDKVAMLPEPESIGNKLSSEEEARLLTECNRSRSRVLFPFVTLAIETGARKNVIRTLAGSGSTSPTAAFSLAGTRRPLVRPARIPAARRLGNSPRNGRGSSAASMTSSTPPSD
jgi:hypothetical protein